MLEKLKLLLNVGDDRDELLEWLLNVTAQRLTILLGLPTLYGDNGEIIPPTFPSDLEYIVIDVACARFNRIASEGMRSDSVEGESVSFYDSDFDPYKKEIASWLAAQEDTLTGGKGKVRFI